MEFLTNNKEWLFFLGGILISAVISLAKAHAFGKTVADKLPKKQREQAIKYIESFLKGMKNEEFNGNKNIISNAQLEKGVKNLTVNLGLKK